MRPEIESIEAIFAPEIEKANLDLSTAQTHLDALIAKKEEYKRQVNEYYEAVDRKTAIDVIIANGLPDNTTISDAAKAK